MTQTLEASKDRFVTHKKPERLPSWLRKSLSPSQKAHQTEELLSDLGLNTICQSGHCPNKNECYSQKTATFMILGNVCTRSCKYCSVSLGKPEDVNPHEADHLVEAVHRLGLEHVVITSVTRDDLPDEGLEHFQNVINKLRNSNSQLIIEVLTPDFRKDVERGAEVFAKLPIDIFNHNIETVHSLHKFIRPQGGYELSLSLLRAIHDKNPNMITKSGAMLGLGETKEEIHQLMQDLRAVGCQMLTLGQYLQPEAKALPVREYVTPATFDAYKDEALSLGFDLVESGPFVRSSYHAKGSFERLKQILGSQNQHRVLQKPAPGAMFAGSTEK